MVLAEWCVLKGGVYLDVTTSILRLVMRIEVRLDETCEQSLIYCFLIAVNKTHVVA